MKRSLRTLFIVLVMTGLQGCFADKKPDSEPMNPPETGEQHVVQSDYKMYLEEIRAQRPLFFAALQSTNPAAPLTVLPAAISAPRGSVPPLGSLHTLVLKYPEIELQREKTVEANKVQKEELTKVQEEVKTESPPQS